MLLHVELTPATPDTSARKYTLVSLETLGIIN